MSNEVVGEVILTDVRLSFFNGFQPAKDRTSKAGELIKGKYGANFLLEKGTDGTKKNIAKIRKAGNDAKQKRWGDEKNWPKLKPEKVCLRDGDLEDYDGYEGCFYLSTNNDKKPQIITNRKDKDGKWIEAEEGHKNAPYSGCYVNALVRIWAQDNEHGKRLNASVEVVQFLRDGEAFSGAAPVDPNEKFTDDMVGDEGSIGDEDEREEEEDLI